jgi:hypothetical protein
MLIRGFEQPTFRLSPGSREVEPARKMRIGERCHFPLGLFDER